MFGTDLGMEEQRRDTQIEAIRTGLAIGRAAQARWMTGRERGSQSRVSCTELCACNSIGVARSLHTLPSHSTPLLGSPLGREREAARSRADVTRH